MGFTYDVHCEMYSTNVDGIHLSISVEKEHERAKETARALAIWHAVAPQLHTYTHQITRSLLDLHNESWNEEEEQTSETQFMERITLQEVSVQRDGRTLLYFDDDDLFWGHVIVAELDEQLQLLNATIAG